MTDAVAEALGRTAACADPAPSRGRQMLRDLRAALPFDAAWLAVADPRCGTFHTVAQVGLCRDLVTGLTGPAMAEHLALAGVDCRTGPVTRSDDPRPAAEVEVWADGFAPAGFQESLSVALHAPDGRRVGVVVLLFESPASPSLAARRRLAGLAPILALGIDPMSSLLATARLVDAATAGASIRVDGSVESLPGLDPDPLLHAGSPVLCLAQQRLRDGACHSSFLWPTGSTCDQHVRVTVVAAPGDVPTLLAGVVLLSPAHDLRHLTPRELEVLGLLVHGCSNQQIARTLFVAPRTVAAHVEHVLDKLDASTRTTAAVRAEREGLYVPPHPDSRRDDTRRRGAEA